MDYSGFAAKVYREQQKIIVEYCKLQAERERRLIAEVELERDKEKTIQEKEKTRQSDNEVKLAEEETKRHLRQEETKRIQQIEETKRLELRLKYGHTTQLQHGADQSTTEINLASQQHNAGADRPQPGSSVEGPLSTDTKIYVQRRQKAVLQHHFHTGQFIKRFDTVKDVQKAYNCCSKTLSQKIKNQGEFLGSRWTYDMEVLKT